MTSTPGAGEIAGAVVLITGARGGIGRALVRAFLDAGAAQVIAAGRTLGGELAEPRVTTCAVDITDDASVAALARRFAPQVDILVNNAGVNGNARLFEDGADERARHEIDVNYLGTLRMLRAFAPAMRAKRRGTIVQILSFAALSNVPGMGSYSASKAALFSLTQAVRAELGPFGIDVCGVFPRVVDTPLTAHLNIPKMSPADVAAAVIAGIAARSEDVFPGPAQSAYAALRADPKAVEREHAARLPAPAPGAPI